MAPQPWNHMNLSFFPLDGPQVRVFTYLIGRDMTFAENVKWIACNNKGEFHIIIVCGRFHILFEEICFTDLSCFNLHIAYTSE